MYTDTDTDTDMDVEDMDEDIASSDRYGTSDPSGSESGSDMDENRAGENAAKKKRGRPVGSARRRSESPTEDFRVREPRKKKMLAIDCLVAAMCCAAMCLGGISQELMVASRENVQSLSRTERKQWLLDYCWSHSNYDEETKKWKFLYMIGTVGACCTAFRQILGIPSSTFYAVRKMFLNKQRVIINRKERQRMTKSKSAVEWLKYYATSFGEKLPNTCQIHLPPCSTKLHVYERMVSESQVEFPEPI
ncbi:uncharacterized protein [Magallana gigas]|uniref:uncharacterized protein n=1 Tax=Magallana gigas TaxID=29159 RepID=UPI00334275E9